MKTLRGLFLYLVCVVVAVLAFSASAFAQDVAYESAAVGRVVGSTPADMQGQLAMEGTELEGVGYFAGSDSSLSGKQHFDEVSSILGSTFSDAFIGEAGGWSWDDLERFVESVWLARETQSLFLPVEALEGGVSLETLYMGDYVPKIDRTERFLSAPDWKVPLDSLILLDADFAGAHLPKRDGFVERLNDRAWVVAPTAVSDRDFVKVFACNLGRNETVGDAYRSARNNYYWQLNKPSGVSLMSYELYGNPAASVSVPGYDASAVEEYCGGFVRDFDSAASVSLAGGDGVAGLDGGGLGDGLVAYWDMSGVGESAVDVRGGFDAAFSAGAVRESDGLSGEWLDLNGVGVWTRSDKGEVWHGLESSSGTLSFWFRTEDASGRVVNLVGTSASFGSQCFSQNPFVQDMGVQNNLFYRGYDSTRNDVDMSVYADGGWHHYVLVSDSGGGYVYIDGVAVGSQPLHGDNCVEASGRNLTFGCDANAALNDTQCSVSPSWDGGIDEVALWSRALTSDEVKELYNGGAGVFCEGRPCSFSSGGGEAVPVTLRKSFVISDYGVVGDGGFSYVVVDGASLLREDGELVLPQISLSEKFPLKTVITDVRASFSAPVDLAADVPEWLGGPVERRCLVNSEDAGVDYSHSFAENSQQLAVSLAPVGVVDCESGSLRLYTEVTYEVDYLSFSPVLFKEVEVSEVAVPGERLVADVVLQNVNGGSFAGELVLERGGGVAEVPVSFSSEKEILVSVPFSAGSEVGVNGFRLGFVQDGEVKSFYDFSVDVSALELAVETPLTAGEGGEVLLLVTNLLGEPLDVVVASELVRDGQPLAGAVDVTLKPGLNMVDLQYAGLRREAGSYELLASVYHGGGKESMAVTLITNHPPVLTVAGEVVVTEGELVALDARAVDVDGDDVEITYSGSMESGVWQTEVGDAGEYEVVVAVSDGLLEDSETVKVTVVELPDLDGDGFVAGVDCDDSDASVYPGAVEVCNEVDDDCSGEVDEGLTRSEACGFCGVQEFACSDGEWVRSGRCVNGGVCVPGDADSLKCGYWHFRTRACNEQCEWERWGQCVAVGECVPGQGEKQRCGSSDVGACSYGERARVCGDDYNWGGWGRCVGSVGPSKEICDGVDNDCDGVVDESLSCSANDACTALLESISASLGSSCGDVSYSAAVDVNRDGAVDIKDLTAVGRKFGDEVWCAGQIGSNASVCG